jgi:Zn-dependent protease
MHSGFKIGRVFGIEIDIDWSWLFIFLLIAWDLGTTFSQLHPEWGGGLAWGVAIIAALLFFGSVLLHERPLAGSQVAGNSCPQHHPLLIRWRLEHSA